jgi:NitT/TauT family transport system ATP-binding protein
VPADASQSAGPQAPAPVQSQGEPTVIALNRVNKQFNGMPVLDSVSLAVRGRRVTALVGPSGCGKTTLLRIVAGLERADSGMVEIAAARIAMVFQEPRLLEWRTAEENVAFVLPAALSSEKRLEMSRAWLSRVGLGSSAKALPPVMSGGMRQRLSLARAYAVPSEAILMDEPFQNLDLAARLELCHLTRALHRSREGATLFVTHDVVEAALVSDQIIVLSPRPMHVVVGIDNPLEEDQRDPRYAGLQVLVSELYERILSSSHE